MTKKEGDKYLKELYQKGYEEGFKQGLWEGFSQAVLMVYKFRFGARPAALVAAVERAGDHAELERLIAIVATLSAEGVSAALRKPRTKQPARAKISRRSASPRRASVAR